jgi:hypothetical protein
MCRYACASSTSAGTRCGAAARTAVHRHHPHAGGGGQHRQSPRLQLGGDHQPHLRDPHQAGQAQPDPRLWPDLDELSDTIVRLPHSQLRSLAGFVGDDIEGIPEVDAIVAANGWEHRVWDRVQHMNADQATCGAGCSGNPYDAGWALQPTSATGICMSSGTTCRAGCASRASTATA